MSKVKTGTSTSDSRIDRYFSEESSRKRILVLQDAKKNGIFIDLADVEDLFTLDLSPAEKCLLLDVCLARNPLALESFLILTALRESQNVAVSAIENWVSRTPRALYFFWPVVAAQPHVAQRVKFRILEHVGAIGCTSVIKQAEKFAHIDDYSEAFHRILLTRAVQWSVESLSIKELAQTYLGLWLENPHVHTATVPSALAYLLRYDRDNVTTFIQKLEPNSIWVEYLKAVAEPSSRAAQSGQWIPVWDRWKISKSALDKYLKSASASLYEYAGVPSDQLFASILRLFKEDSIGLIQGFVKIEPLLSVTEKEAGLAGLIKLMEGAENITDILRVLPTRTTFQLQGFASQTKFAGEMWALNKQFVASPNIETNELESKLRELGRTLGEFEVNLTSRKQYLQGWATEQKSAQIKLAQSAVVNDGVNSSETFWSTLAKFKEKPSASLLQELSTLQRQVPAVWRQAYVAALSLCRDMDEAVLKTLDFCRSDEEGVLRTVFAALRGVGTSKAAMELVNYITRPNVSLGLKFEIAETLKDMDISKIQHEIRSAITDLKDPNPVHSEFHELKNFLQGLLEPESKDAADVVKSSQDMSDLAMQASPAFLDTSLRAQFRYFDDFSSEVKRALRTAKFFDNQTRNGSAQSGIDLSPVVDMQYKALEILFRELFEKECTRFIQNGAMQRKLDMIGYARPIETEMTRFENYLAALPVVSSIPFFSKFKLRKLLRAICQYRPGKRFTLDGLKAFGLFFLTFARREDQFGLGGVLDLPFANDRELAMFCKQLHEFQDLRNRAAHEGFHPDASQNVDAIWEVTSAISEIAWDLQMYMKDKKGFGDRRLSYSA